VFLEHRSHPLIVDKGYVDRIETTTDERGQFSVEMLPASAYTVWARSAVGEDGSYRQTGVALDAVARSPIQMAEGERGFVRRLRIAPAVDDDSWAGVEVRYVLRCGVRTHVWSQELNPVDGVLHVPPACGDTVALELWCGPQRVRTVYVAVTLEGLRQIAVTGFPSPDGGVQVERFPAAAQQLTDIALPRLERRSVSVTSSAGVAIQWVRLRPEASLPWPVASEGPAPLPVDDGRLELLEAMGEERPRWIHTLVQAAGHVSGSFARDEPDVVLDPGSETAGRLFWAPEVPAAGVPLVVEGAVAAASGSWWSAEPRVVYTGADGTFRIPGRRDRVARRLSAALPLERRASLSRPRFPAAPIAVLHYGWKNGEDLGALVLSHLEGRNIRIAGADGTPPGSQELLVTEVDRGSDGFVPMVRIRTDHRGCVRFVADQISGRLLLTGNGKSVATHRFASEDQDPLVVPLSTATLVRLRVTDTEDRPLAGVHAALVDSGRGAERFGLEPALLNVALQSRYRGGRGRSDANGCVTLVPPFISDTYDVYLRPTDAAGREVSVDTRNVDQKGRVTVVLAKK